MASDLILMSSYTNRTGFNDTIVPIYSFNCCSKYCNSSLHLLPKENGWELGTTADNFYFAITKRVVHEVNGYFLFSYWYTRLFFDCINDRGSTGTCVLNFVVNTGDYFKQI